MLGQNVLHCILRGSNPRGLCPLGLKSSALTTRPRMRVRRHSVPTAPKKVGAPRVRLELTTYRLTAGRATDCAIQELILYLLVARSHICKNRCTACGDRTRDQSIKSRTLYLTELRRPVLRAFPPRSQVVSTALLVWFPPVGEMSWSRVLSTA